MLAAGSPVIAAAPVNPPKKEEGEEEGEEAVENVGCKGMRERRRSVLDDLVDAAAMSVPVLDDTLPPDEKEQEEEMMVVDDVGVAVAVNPVPAAPTQVLV